jgi:hypothetical protein
MAQTLWRWRPAAIADLSLLLPRAPFAQAGGVFGFDLKL